MVELSVGRKVKGAPKKKWNEAQRRIKTIVESYANYGVARYRDYLQAIGCKIVIL